MRDRRSSPLFDALPAYVRLRDGQEQRALEALMALLTDELEVVEQDIDQLFDNWFVETCEGWVLPYIADLIGARPMREIGDAGSGQLRAYVANVLQYRQAKGTAAALEQVARDVSGWPVIVVEFFQHLATSENVNHPRPGRQVVASLRRADAPQLAHRPFSRASHLPAAGSITGFSGRFNIPNLGIFVWRHGAQLLFPLISEAAGYLGGPVPALLTPDGAVRRFDPLGRDLPLVNLPDPDLTVAERVSPLNVPGQLRREPLADELDGLRDGSVKNPQWFDANPVLRIRLGGAEIEADRLHCCHLGAASDGSIRQPDAAGHVLFDPVLGRLSLHDSDKGKAAETGFTAAQPFDIGGGAYDRRASLESWWDDIFVAGEPAPWRIGVSSRVEDQTADPDQGGPVVGNLRAAIQQWNAQSVAGQRGIITILDSGTYAEPVSGANAIDLKPGCQLVIVAAGWPGRRSTDGTFRREAEGLTPALRRPHVPTRLGIKAAPGTGEVATRLVLSGLALKDIAIPAGQELQRLDVLDCTVGVDSGAFVRALWLNGQETLRLSIERSVVGQLPLGDVAAPLTIADSIIGFGPNLALGDASVIELPIGDLAIARCTVFGRIAARTIEMENSIATGRITAAHRQQGCVRFSYLPSASVVPRRYRCVSETSGGSSVTLRPSFVSDRFADPGFALLARGCPVEILEGADGNLEMGVGFRQRVPARLANLREAAREYAPFGLGCGIHFVNE